MSEMDDNDNEINDFEMLDNNSIITPMTLSEDNLIIIEDHKRLCTERSSSTDSIDIETNANLNLSPISNALNNSTLSTTNEEEIIIDLQQANNNSENILSGIVNFKPTQLEIIEEGEFVWSLENFRETGFSPIFRIAEVDWTINYSINERPSGNKFVGLHLALADPDGQLKDCNSSVCAEFILGIYNPKPDLNLKSSLANLNIKNSSSSSIFSSLKQFTPASPASILKKTREITLNGRSLSSFHRFCVDEIDYGFNQICSVSAFKEGIPDLHVGPLATSEGETNIIAKVRVVKDNTGVLWHNFNKYDSKEVTGFVGLLNQGATCYMNSFVQSIFLTNEFRSAVYRIPTDKVSPTSSIPAALQRIFYKLQTARNPPSTTEMTKSFGWDTTESFMQHDVQEFSRVLMDDLENKMKGSEVEGTVERLFRGKLRNVLKCTEVNYESVREESFYDLQMTIKNVKDLKESFERYVTAEMLNGDNQYRTDDFGLQDAKKFITFDHFPPVLHVHLERYAFDMMAETTVKIHDRFEFPVEIDLDPYLSETSPDRSSSQTYWLHSVLVHAGDGHGGHYFVYIRHPSRPDCWYKFDDTKVIPCTQHEAVDDNFGGYEAVSNEEANELLRSTGVKPYRYKKFTSAYLLVYIRKSDLNTVLADVKESDVPEYLIERIKEDDLAEARRRHERQQQYLVTDVTVLTDKSLRAYSGPDMFDLDSRVNTYKCKREMTVAEVCTEVFRSESAESTTATTPLENDEEGKERAEFDGWEIYVLSGRRNKTIRPDVLLSDIEIRTVGSFVARFPTYPITFYIRPTISNAGNNLWRLPKSEDRILVVFKWYDFDEETGDEVFGVLGSMSICRNQTFSSVTSCVIEKLKKLGVDFDGTEDDLSFYEEFKPQKIKPIETDKTFIEIDLRSGDIVLVERKMTKKTVADYFADLLSWREVDIEPVPFQQKDQNSLKGVRISKNWNISSITRFIGEKLNLNPEHLRINFQFETKCVSNTNYSNSLDLTSEESVDLNHLKYIPSDSTEIVKDFLSGTSSIDQITIIYEISNWLTATEADKANRFFIEAGLSLEKGMIRNTLPGAIYLKPEHSTYKNLINQIYDDLKIYNNLIQNLDPKKFKLLEVGKDGRIKRIFGELIDESLNSIDFENCSHLLLESEENDNYNKDIKDPEPEAEIETKTETEIQTEIETETETEIDTKTTYNSSETTKTIDNSSVSKIKTISCFTFEKSSTKPFGIPFLITLNPNEDLENLRNRLAKKLKLTDTEFKSAVLYLITGTRERKLDDPTEILSNLPGTFSFNDHLGIQIANRRQMAGGSGFDGAIRFRKQEQEN